MLFVTELLMLVGAFGGGLGLLFILVLLGLPAGPNAPAWSPIIQGPLLMAGAGLSYWLFQLIGFGRGPKPISAAQGARESRSALLWPDPLCPSGDRASILKSLGLVAMMVTLAVLGSMGLALLQEALLEVTVEEQDAILEIVEGGATVSKVLLGITAVVLAPVTEEFLFRGMMFRRLKNGVGARRGFIIAAYLVPSALFSAAHWNPVGFAVYIWLALCFTASYRLSGRLWAAMLTHAGANAITLALLLTGA